MTQLRRCQNASMRLHRQYNTKAFNGPRIYDKYIVKMILRVWILGILLIVILCIIWKWSSQEGFQSGSAYRLPAAAEGPVILSNFWTIVDEQKVWRSSGSAGSSGSLGSRRSTKQLLDAVMNPGPTDLLAAKFPGYISIYALSKYNKDPVAARYALLNDFDTLQTEIVQAVQTPYEKVINSTFTSAPQQTACFELDTAAVGLYGQLIALHATVTDLSGTELLAESLHDENIRMQGSSACMNQGATPSVACIRLATQDETLFPLLRQYNTANMSLATNGKVIQDSLDTILQAYKGMKCGRTYPGGLTTPPSGLSITTLFSAEYLDNIGTVDTESLSMKLEQLSPYYISSNIINIITRQLMAGTAYKAELQSTVDYVRNMSKTTNNIISLTTQMGSGKFFDESGAAGVATCPAGFFCPATSSTPVPCPVGTYCPAGTTGEPWPCPPGRPYSDKGASDETQCRSSIPDGYYDDDGKPLMCPVGSWCAGGRINACPAGTYGPNKGKTQQLGACINCPAGSYCPPSTTVVKGVTLGSASSVPCDAGTFSAATMATNKTTCQDCPAGTTCPKKGQAVPIQCPAGTFSAATKFTKDCTPGPAGKYSSTTGATSDSGFQICPIGSYCPIGSGYPMPCSAGGYCDVTGLSSAKLCPSGRYQDSAGNSDPRCKGDCAAGYYCAEGSISATQSSCPTGFYCPAGTPSPVPCAKGAYCIYGSAVPTPCPPATYLDQEGGSSISSCMSCPTGKYCPGVTAAGSSGSARFPVGTVTPLPCPVGNFCPVGTGTPIPCLPGGFCDETGLSVSKSCPQGTYNPSAGASIQTQCIPCEPGTYNNQLGQTSCEGVCQAGYYCPKTTQCIIYNIGGSSSAGSNTLSVPIGSVDQIPCPQGYYCPSTNMSTPIPCGAGTFSTATKATSQATCMPCLPGAYCPTMGMGSGATCPPGTYCPGGGSQPNQCPVAAVCPIPGLGAEQPCPPGRFCSTEGEITGQPCPRGTYSMGGAGNSCTQCPAGTYGNATGLETAACSGPCAAGYYCPVGSRGQYGNKADGSAATGAANSTSVCPIGSYCAQGSALPSACPAGTYGNAAGLTTATCSGPCAAGHYCPEGSSGQYGGTATTAASSTTKCQVGSYSTGGATTASCRRCRAGRYGTATAMTTSACSGPCIAGYYCPAGSTGEYGNTATTATAATNATPSTKCPPGHYCPTGTGSPIPCAAGTFGNATAGATTPCTSACPAGKYCCPGTTSSSSSQTCPAGYYCPIGSGPPLTGAACSTDAYGSSGSYSTVTIGAVTAGIPAIPCPAGRASAATGRSNNLSCVNCDAGYYSNAGSSQCTACPAGSFSSAAGSTACRLCPTNTYSTGSITGTSSCTPCLEGQYSASGASTCSACPLGTTSLASGSGSSGSGGSSICRACPAGKYGTTTGSASICNNCPINTYSEVIGATSSGTCNMCANGSTAPAGSASASACTVCPTNSIINAAGVCVTCSSLFNGDTRYRTPGPGYTGSQFCTLSIV
jgi:hypothetical protein